MAKTYTIKPGDTWGNITAANKIDSAELLKLNPDIKDPNKIAAGATLNLPDSVSMSAEQAVPTNPLSFLTGSGKTPAVVTSDSIRMEEEKKKADQQKADQDAAAELARLTTSKQIADLKAAVGPEGGAPAKPNLEGAYTGLLSETDASGQSYNSLQAKNVDLNKRKEEAVARLREFEKGIHGGVTAGFAAGAVSEEAKKVQDEVDAINREITTNSLLISNRADVINTIMGLKKEDYANASSRYDKELSTNLSLFSTLGTQKDKATDNARASLQIIQNQISSGKTKYQDMTPDQRATVENLEVQAGYPKNFTQFLTANVKADIVSTNSRTADDGTVYFDVLTRNSDGSFGKTTIVAGPGKKPTTGADKLLSSQQYAQLAVAGIDQELADILTGLEVQGKDQDEIRTALEKSNLDPGLYDIFRNVYQK